MADRIDPAKVIETIDYSHPVFTPEGVAAQARQMEISGADRIHYCGAYWRWGFHEDGVVSALRALERVGGAPAQATPGGGRVSASAIYDGWVRHRRHEPVDHDFSYRHAMLLLDLDELPRVLELRPWYSASGRALARFRRQDYLGDPERPLADCVRDLVEERTGTPPARPGAPADHAAHVRPLVQPGELLLLLRPRRRARGGRGGRRDQHPLGREPRLRAGPRRRGLGHARHDGQGLPRVAVHRHGRPLRLARDRARTPAAGAHRRDRRRRHARVRRHAVAAAARADARAA